jgi:lysophospholipase L1-like esterase
MSSFYSKNKWLIIGGLGVIGLGVLTAILFESFTTIKNKNPKKILFLGDSITADNNSYANNIKKSNPNLQIEVKASVGKKTSWMLQSLKDLVAQKKSYDRIYVYGGINDIFSGSSKDVALSNLQAIVNLGNQMGADVFVIEGVKTDGYMDINKMPITQYVSSKNDYLPIIQKYDDFQSSIKGGVKNAKLIKTFNLSDNTNDGIHPTIEGQNIITKEILKTL